jgi:hypothetical protein
MPPTYIVSALRVPAALVTGVQDLGIQTLEIVETSIDCLLAAICVIRGVSQCKTATLCIVAERLWCSPRLRSQVVHNSVCFSFFFALQSWQVYVCMYVDFTYRSEPHMD